MEHENVRWVVRIGRRSDGEVIFAFEEGFKATEEEVKLLEGAALSVSNLVKQEQSKRNIVKWWPNDLTCKHCGALNTLREEPACYVMDCKACHYPIVIQPTSQGERHG